MINFETNPRSLRLRSRDGDEQLIVADVEETGCFGVHKSIGVDRRRLWTVTHVATKTAVVDGCATKDQAFGIVTALLQLGWDWSNHRLSYYRQQMKDAPPAVQIWFQEIGVYS